MLLIFLPFGLRRNPVWRDSSNVKRERAVWDAKAETSFALVIWLNENVPIVEFSLA